MYILKINFANNRVYVTIHRMYVYLNKDVWLLTLYICVFNFIGDIDTPPLEKEIVPFAASWKWNLDIPLPFKSDERENKQIQSRMMHKTFVRLEYCIEFLYLLDCWTRRSRIDLVFEVLQCARTLNIHCICIGTRNVQRNGLIYVYSSMYSHD